MIADYTFYRDEYYGDVIAEEDLPKYAAKADLWLDELTFGRYAGVSEGNVLRAVKMAECAIAEQCLYLAVAGRGGNMVWNIASEKVGNHSVSYRSSGDPMCETGRRILRLAERYLGRYGLLYRGLNMGCGHDCTP